MTDKSSSRHLIYDIEREAFYDTDGMEWVPKQPTAGKSIGSLIALKAELERWFDSASEIAREWVDFENEAKNILHIIRQHEAETLQYKGQNFTIGEGKPPKEIPYENEDTATGEVLSSEIRDNAEVESAIAETIISTMAKWHYQEVKDPESKLASAIHDAIRPYLATREPVMVNRPSRIEVIDHRASAPDIGRLPPKAIDVSWQDDDRTLKIFIKD